MRVGAEGIDEMGRGGAVPPLIPSFLFLVVFCKAGWDGEFLEGPLWSTRLPGGRSRKDGLESALIGPVDYSRTDGVTRHLSTFFTYQQSSEFTRGVTWHPMAW